MLGPRGQGRRQLNKSVRVQSDLREHCLAEALTVIGEVGIENLSLREVARRLGVSHQAPYRHFPSRDHLLAEVVDRVFQEFGEYLTEGMPTDDPRADFVRMGRRYLEYAAEKPLEYRLMFGATLPDPREHPDMMEKGCLSFDGLREVLSRILEVPADSERVTLEAMFVWSTIHGLASIRETEAMGGLGIDDDTQARVIDHVLARIDSALEADRP